MPSSPKPAICVAIKGPSIEEASQQITQALPHADIIELRLDLFGIRDLSSIQSLRTKFPIPMIFTLRSRQQGGEYNESETVRLSEMRQLASLKPEYLDIESEVPKSFIQEISSHYPQIKIILSNHNFINTPDNLDILLQEMRKIPASFYKIAVTAANSIDTLRLLSWCQQAGNNNDLIAISMGQYGEISRIVGPLFGSCITYACLDDTLSTAPGQLSAKILAERYHYKSLNPHTALYGLIGNPVTKSISDVAHNASLRELGLNAVYIKIPITPDELPEFLKIARTLPFKGLSVTMPLKEAVMSHIDHINDEAKAIGAVNTLKFDQGKIYGINTDGIGALNAIEKHITIKGKKVTLIGAGGAAKAIAYEAHKRGALLTILNRDIEKAKKIASDLGCVAAALNAISFSAHADYDLLINCTPSPMPIPEEYLRPSAYIMDITTRPKETELLQAAQKKGCSLIYGYEMFVQQAQEQLAWWFNLNNVA